MTRLAWRSPSVVRAAIRQAALDMGLADPLPIADEILGVDVDALHQWFAAAARTSVHLWQGTSRLADALPVLAAGWSSQAPVHAINGQRQAGLASRDVIGAQVDAADATGATLRQSRVLADDALADAEGAIYGTGWPPGDDLLRWAAEHQKLLEVSGAIVGLCHRLEDLRSRNENALHTLAAALRTDPRDPVEQLEAARTATAVGTPSSRTPPAMAPDVGQVTGAGINPAPDRANLDRLAQDLRSTDFAVLAMAMGVSAALQKARNDGGVAQLLVYESANSGSQGRAAISVGEIASADNVAVLAPGVTNAPASMADGISDAVALRNAAQQQAPGDSTAVVAWYGYDIPLSWTNGVPVNAFSTLTNTVAALDDDNARAGGDLLAGDIEQFHDMAPAAARFVTVGFSMGATTVSAASARGARVDDMVMLASPGASRDVETAADYPDLPAEHAFVAAYEQDAVTTGPTDVLAGIAGGMGWVPTLAPFGPDPADADFGAQVIDVQTNASAARLPEIPFLPLSGLPNDVLELAATHQEANYLSGESLAAVAAVVNGRYSEVPIKTGR
jgi:hypothetical protein